MQTSHFSHVVVAPYNPPPAQVPGLHYYRGPVVGIYALLAGYVTRQTKEIGVRMALGAKQTNILNWIVLRGAKLIGLGIIIGIVSAVGLARAIANMLYGVTPLDPVTLGLTILVLSLSGIVACFVPALRAARVNPIVALRE